MVGRFAAAQAQVPAPPHHRSARLARSAPGPAEASRTTSAATCWSSRSSFSRPRLLVTERAARSKTRWRRSCRPSRRPARTRPRRSHPRSARRHGRAQRPVPPDVLIKLSESLPVREAARLRRAAAQRMQQGRRPGLAQQSGRRLRPAERGRQSRRGTPSLRHRLTSSPSPPPGGAAARPWGISPRRPSRRPRCSTSL